MGIFDDERYGGPEELLEALGHPRDWLKKHEYLQRAQLSLKGEVIEFIPAHGVRGWFWREIRKKGG